MVLKKVREKEMADRWKKKVVNSKENRKKKSFMHRTKQKNNQLSQFFALS